MNTHTQTAVDNKLWAKISCQIIADHMEAEKPFRYAPNFGCYLKLI